MKEIKDKAPGRAPQAAKDEYLNKLKRDYAIKKGILEAKAQLDNIERRFYGK